MAAASMVAPSARGPPIASPAHVAPRRAGASYRQAGPRAALPVRVSGFRANFSVQPGGGEGGRGGAPLPPRRGPAAAPLRQSCANTAAAI